MNTKKEPSTELERGIVVSIGKKEFEKLKVKAGFLSFEAYPDEYKEFSLENEVGRYLVFRFILTKALPN